MGKNRGLKRIWRSLKEYERWGNWGIFGSLGSWVKYGGNMEGVGRSGKVWGVEKSGGKCGEYVLECGRSEGRCRGMGSSTHFPHTFLHISLTPHLLLPLLTLLHTPTYFPTSPSTLSHFFHIPTILDPTPQTTKNSPITPPFILLQTPPNSLYSLILPHTPHSYFII